MRQLQIQDSHRVVKERVPAKYSEEVPIHIEFHNVPVQVYTNKSQGRLSGGSHPHQLVQVLTGFSLHSLSELQP